MKIFKYPLEITDEQEVTLPYNSKILSCQMQNELLQLCALVDETTDVFVEKIIRIIGTGNPIDDYDPTNFKFISTVQDTHGLVWHIFLVD